MSKTWVYSDLLEYHKDGYFIWKKSPRNGIAKGSRAGSLMNTGYYAINIRRFGGLKLVHRLVYEYHHGECPELIDHIDRDRTNNRIENLRPATRSLNAHNSDYTCGQVNVRGVSWSSDHNKYAAYLKNNGKRKFLGYFDTVEAASSAYSTYKKEVVGNE